MANRVRLTGSQIDQLVAEQSALPADYLQYLRDIGWGETPSGHMIYSGPISPNAVYPQLSGETQRVILGDDMQGYCLGYDFAAKTYGEYSDFGEWSSFPNEFDLASILLEPA